MCSLILNVETAKINSMTFPKQSQFLAVNFPSPRVPVIFEVFDMALFSLPITVLYSISRVLEDFAKAVH